MDKSMSLLPLVFCFLVPAAVQGADQSRCVLSSAIKGQVITVHGKVLSEPHDLGFQISGCNDTVLLTYAGDQDSDVSADQSAGGILFHSQTIGW